jgi:hypothetical protein
MSNSYLLDWRKRFLAALGETDKDKLTALVYAAELAIFLRLQELADSADHNEERSEIQVACAALLSIQVNDLGWPLSLPGGRTALPQVNPQ